MPDVTAFLQEIDAELSNDKSATTETPEKEDGPKDQEVSQTESEPKAEEAKKDEDERQETDEEREVRRARNRAIREAKKARASLEKAESELAELKARLSQTSGDEGQLNDVDFQKAVDAKARQLLAEKESIRVAEDFRTRLEADKKELPPDFDDLLEEHADEAIPPHLFEAIQQSQSPGAVLYHILDNPQEMQRLASLSSFRLGQEFAKIEPPKRRAVSSAPKPVEPAQGVSVRQGIPDDPDAFDAWMEKKFIYKR